MAFTRNDVKNLRVELQTVLDKFAEAHGVTVKVGNATYSDVEVNFKVNLTDAAVDVGKAKWVESCKWYGLCPEDYGKRIILNGEAYIVAGLKTTATKNIVIITKESTGKQYVISRDTFIRCGGKDAYDDLTFVETAPPEKL